MNSKKFALGWKLFFFICSWKLEQPQSILFCGLRLELNLQFHKLLNKFTFYKVCIMFYLFVMNSKVKWKQYFIGFYNWEQYLAKKAESVSKVLGDIYLIIDNWSSANPPYQARQLKPNLFKLKSLNWGNLEMLLFHFYFHFHDGPCLCSSRSMVYDRQMIDYWSSRQSWKPPASVNDWRWQISTNNRLGSLSGRGHSAHSNDVGYCNEWSYCMFS